MLESLRAAPLAEDGADARASAVRPVIGSGARRRNRKAARAAFAVETTGPSSTIVVRTGSRWLRCVTITAWPTAKRGRAAAGSTSSSWPDDAREAPLNGAGTAAPKTYSGTWSWLATVAAAAETTARMVNRAPIRGRRNLRLGRGGGAARSKIAARDVAPSSCSWRVKEKH
jgi:hypothetical protein